MPAAGTLGKHEESFAKEDSAYHLVVHAFDVDSKLFGDIVRYRFVRKPCWLTVDSLSGSITGIPHVGNGDTLFSVMAADGLLSDTLHVRVHVFHTNHPPVIESVPDTICYFGYRYSYQVVAPDPDTVIGDRRHYALIKSPRWLSIDSSGGLVSGTPPPSTSIHTDVIEVEVGDGAGAHVTQTFALRNSPRIGRGLESRIPDSFVLEQNYPNPFNPITRIVFGVPQTASVEVEIFNILGQSLCRLADGIHEPGYYAVDWDGNGGHAASGVYFVRIQARSADRRETLYITAKKMLLLK
jgi:hypothetical protein